MYMKVFKRYTKSENKKHNTSLNFEAFGINLDSRPSKAI